MKNKLLYIILAIVLILAEGGIFLLNVVPIEDIILTKEIKNLNYKQLVKVIKDLEENSRNSIYYNGEDSIYYGEGYSIEFGEADEFGGSSYIEYKVFYEEKIIYQSQITYLAPGTLIDMVPPEQLKRMARRRFVNQHKVLLAIFVIALCLSGYLFISSLIIGMSKKIKSKNTEKLPDKLVLRFNISLILLEINFIVYRYVCFFIENGV